MNYHRKKGFTLFEMMVSISIFVMITTIAVVNYRKFGNDVFINNLAYDIALTIRKAQSYGINVRGTSANNFSYGYGVHFDIRSSPNPCTGVASNTCYKIFVDSLPSEPDLQWNNAAEDVETFNLLKGSTVSSLCVTSSSGEDCTVDVLDLVFLRPNPDAHIYFHTTGGATGGTTGYTSARIVIRAVDGREKSIVVYGIGQISVKSSL